MVPSAMPLLDIGTTIRRMMSKRLAPASIAASDQPSCPIRAIELKIGTIMKIVSCVDIGDDHRQIGEQQHFSGWRITPSASSAWLIRPSLPSSGIREIIRMMLEVQNGTVQSRNRPIAEALVADVEHQEIGDEEADDQA